MFKNPQELEKFVDKFEKSELTYLYLEYDNFKLKLDKRAGVQLDEKAATECAATEMSENCEFVTAPLVGIFYTSVGGEKIAPVGSKVKKGQMVCAVEAMKMMNDIVAPCDGVVKDVLVTDGKMVEFGQKLMVIEKE